MKWILIELEKFTTETQTKFKNLADVKNYIENIKNRKDIKNRILPIINKTAKLDKKINIFDYVEQELQQSKYSHSIEFDINKNTNILDLNKIKLGDKFILYFNNKEYETILSAIQYENNKNTIHLVFGKARINFIDMLKKIFNFNRQFQLLTVSSPYKKEGKNMFLDKKLKLEYEKFNKNCFSSHNKQEYFLEEYCPNNEDERNLHFHGGEQWKLYNTKKFKIIIDTWDLNEAIEFLQSCQEKIKKEENKITSEWKIIDNK